MTGLVVDNLVVDPHDFDSKGFVNIFRADISEAIPGSTVRVLIRNNTAVIHRVSKTDDEISYSVPYTFLLKRTGYWINGSAIMTTPEGEVFTYPYATRIIGMNELRICNSGRNISMSMDIENLKLRSMVGAIGKQISIRPWLPDETLEAIWNEVVGLGLNYTSITGSTEPGYQHTRDVEEILQDRVMNCVDGTLLFMTLFKIIGAKPVYVSVPGHAMPGILLSVDDEVVAKTAYNRYAVEVAYKGKKLRILPIESTMVCNSAGVSRFIEAIQRGSEKMAASSSRITVPSLDNIPVMLRQPSVVVFRWHRSSTGAGAVSTRSRYSAFSRSYISECSVLRLWISKSKPILYKWAVSRR